MILVHLLVISTSNVYVVAERTSKQNTISSYRLIFFHSFCCKLAHTWRYMCAFYLHFLLDLCMIRLKLTFCVILLYLYQEPDVSEEFLSPAAPLKVSAGHSFWWWGWLPCPVPPGTSRALPSTSSEGAWEGVQDARRVPGDELSSQPGTVPLSPPSRPGSWKHNENQWRQRFVQWTWGYGQNLA